MGGTEDPIGLVGAAKVVEVAIGLDSMLVVPRGVLKAAIEPTAASEKKAAIQLVVPSPSFPGTPLCRAGTESERLEKDVVDPMAAFW